MCFRRCLTLTPFLQNTSGRLLLGWFSSNIKAKCKLISFMKSHCLKCSIDLLYQIYDPRSIRSSVTCAAQKMKFSIQDFFSKCDQIRSFQIIFVIKSSVRITESKLWLFKVSTMFILGWLNKSLAKCGAVGKYVSNDPFFYLFSF